MGTGKKKKKNNKKKQYGKEMNYTTAKVTAIYKNVDDENSSPHEMSSWMLNVKWLLTKKKTKIKN